MQAPSIALDTRTGRRYHARAMTLKLRLASTLTALAVAVAALPVEYFGQAEVDSRSTHVESQTNEACGDSQAADACASDCHCLCCPSHANAAPPHSVSVSVVGPTVGAAAPPAARQLVPGDASSRIFHPPKRA